MRMKSLLAVGESILAAKDEPSPYEIRKECRLPVFGEKTCSQPLNQPLTPVLSPSDGAREKTGESLAMGLAAVSPQKEINFSAPERETNFGGLKKETSFGAQESETGFEARMKMGPERRAIEPEPEERRRLLGRKTRGGARNLTQAELRLEQVKVVRNDLSDSDLELAPRRKARSGEADINPFAPRPIAAMGRPAHEKQGWAARLARLLGIKRRGRP
jgi:hypothetical protein